MAEWILETLAGADYVIEPDEWELARYFDEGTIRASEATLTLSRRVPVADKQWIRLVENGKTQFLGYVARKPTIEGLTKKTIQAFGVEALLFSCPCPTITIPYDTYTIPDLFSDSAQPGLIFAANSLIPPGWLEDTLPSETTDDWIAHGPATVVDATTGIAKFANCGTRSRFGTTTITVNGVNYTDRASYALMAANDRSTYRDADDLWIHFYYSSYLEYGYKYLPWYCLNAFDTRCRTGTIESTYVFNTPIKLGPNNMVGDILEGVATVHGLNLRPRYVGKICYIDALEDFTDDGVYEIHEEECSKIDYRETTYSPSSSLTSVGACPRLFQQMQSVLYTNVGGAFVRSQTEFPEAYYDSGGNLCVLTTAQWSATRPKSIVTVTTDRHNFMPLGADVDLILLQDAVNRYQFRSIKRKSTGQSQIELGARSLDVLDAMSALDAVSNAYAIEVLPEISSIASMSGTVTVGASNKSEVSYTSGAFTLPALATVSAQNPRVLADISLSSATTGMVRPYDSVARFKVSVDTDTSFAAANVVQEASSQHYLVAKDELTGLDITRKCTWGGANYMNVSVVLLGALPNAGDNTNFTIYVKIYIVGRREMS